MKVALLPNLRKRSVIDISQQIIDWLLERSHSIATTASAQKKMARSIAVIDPQVKYDLAIVLGGDGTLLYHGRQQQWHNTPILGVKLGYLGYLTEVELHDLFRALPMIEQGKYEIEERMMCEVSVLRGGEKLADFPSINEAVVSKGAVSRMIRLDLYVGDHYLETYPADGIIVSTPTGSTAYSLSAGGPLVYPEMNLLIITPIAAHTLFARPLIVPVAKPIRIVPAAKHADLHLSVDGQEHFALQSEDIVEIRACDKRLRLIRLWHRSFYDVLRRKLRRTFD